MNISWLNKCRILIAISLLLPAFVHAASVLPLGLERLVGDAKTVFNGRCISNQVEQDVHSNMVVTYTTYEVLDAIKGDIGITHTIKQIGGQLPGSNIHMKWPGIPKFTVGEEYVVFLPGKSNKGFSSPVGLQQGKFSVKGAAGGKEVGNGKDFQELLKNVPEGKIPPAVMNLLNNKFIKKSGNPANDAANRAKMNLDDFLSMVRSIGASK